MSVADKKVTATAQQLLFAPDKAVPLLRLHLRVVHGPRKIADHRTGKAIESGNELPCSSSSMTDQKKDESLQRVINLGADIGNRNFASFASSTLVFHSSRRQMRFNSISSHDRLVT